MLNISTILKSPELTTLFETFLKAGSEVRLVGGCVRDSLLGLQIGDIDMAVNVPPLRAKEILETAGIKVIPTGIDHGTITAIIHKIPFQITSLRQDWKTNGRHAQVVFGTDWLADAKRRDFTMNAIYLDGCGNLYDPLQGQVDLEKGIVRFIGDPFQRIQEDYLRILRYYRFLAYYGKGGPLKISELKTLKDGLTRLSAERVQGEVLKLLNAENPLPALTLMKEDGVFETVFGKDVSFEQLTLLIEREKRFFVPPFSWRRFYALFQNQPVILLSNRQKEYLKNLHQALSEDDPRRVYYFYGKDLTCDWGLFRDSCEETLAWLHGQPAHTFPLKGQDLLGAGVPVGPAVGDLLKKAEAFWISKDFLPDKDACLQYCLKLDV